jgi:hypothetical protein
VTDNFPAIADRRDLDLHRERRLGCPASGLGNLAASVDLLSGGTATFTVTATATGSGTISNTATIAAPVRA